MVGATIQRLSHSATVTSGARGSNRTTIAGFSDQRLDHVGNPHENLVEMERIELSSSRCKREVLPLNDIPTNWYQRMESNHLLRAYQTRAQPESFAGMEVSARIELASQPYKCCASPAMLADHKSLEPRPRIERGSHLYQRCTLPLSYQGWSQGGESNSGRSVTRALLSH